MTVQPSQLVPGDIIAFNRLFFKSEKEVLRVLLTYADTWELEGVILYALGSPEKVGKTYRIKAHEYALDNWRMI